MPLYDELKTVVDSSGLINEGTKQLLELMDFQNKNIFEILISPAKLGSISPTMALDNIISKMYIQKLSLPFAEFEYEKIGNIKYVKGITNPNECQIIFIEDELGTVRNYINNWQKDIAFPDPENPGGYVFRDDQDGAKKNAIIILQSGLGAPTPGWIKVSGLKYRSMGSLELDYSDGTPMLMEINFSVDTIDLKTIF